MLQKQNTLLLKLLFSPATVPFHDYCYKMNIIIDPCLCPHRSYCHLYEAVTISRLVLHIIAYYRNFISALVPLDVVFTQLVRCDKLWNPDQHDPLCSCSQTLMLSTNSCDLSNVHDSCYTLYRAIQCFRSSLWP